MTLALALLLDALLGEPRWLWSRLPHPAVLIGRGIGWADARFNRGDGRFWKGLGLVAALVAGAVALGLLAALPGQVIDIILAAILLAHRSLVQHVRAVADALRMSVAEGRRSVAMIVGRDTSGMDGPAVARAAVESAAENFSDGVVAPAFWFALFGLPGILAYKAINTADSMIGYRTERHEQFGKAAARLDDVANWVPARLTALLFWLVSGMAARWGAIAADARLHRSPNAGWPEAAAAPALGIALSGPRSYDGRMRDFPFVNAAGRRDAGPGEIEAAVALLWRAWTLGLVTALCLALLGVIL